MIVAGSLTYDSETKVKQLSPEQYAELRLIYSSLPDKQEEVKYYSHLSGDKFFNADEVASITSLGLKLEITKSSRNSPHKSLLNTGPVSGGKCAGQPVHVHVPSIGLLCIDEVTWLEDACTENLQAHLDDGWRILAVCPPNLQRRPDYILGRAKERK